MKIIDFAKKRNVVRFYLGADDLEKWWGDDWNDAPYNCNAGPVYDEYVSGYRDFSDKITGKNAEMKKVVFHDPATIVFWTDGTKTVVKCQPGDRFDPLTGFLMAFFKKAYGNKGNYNDALRKIVPGYGGKEDDDA